MQVVKTFVWVLLLAALLVFSALNWKPVEVNIWSGLVLETKLPALVIIAFLIGMVPMWLLHQGTKWRLRRRIGSLETAHRTAINANTPPAPTPAATTSSASVAPDATSDKLSPTTGEPTKDPA